MTVSLSLTRIEPTAAGSEPVIAEGVLEYHNDTDILYVSDGTTKNQVYPATGGGGGDAGTSRARVTKSGDQASVSSGTELTWDQEDFDTDAIHDNSSNNTRLTIPTGKDGVWMFGSSFFTTNTSNSPIYSFLLNGTTIVANLNRAQNGSSVSHGFTGTTIYNMAAGDYMEVSCTSGAGHTVSASTAVSKANFWAVWMGA